GATTVGCTESRSSRTRTFLVSSRISSLSRSVVHLWTLHHSFCSVRILQNACHILFIDCLFFFSSRRRHTRLVSDWSSDVCLFRSLANFRACLDLRIGFEFDVRRTRDGHLVCLHDEAVDRTTDGEGKVADLTLDQVRKLDEIGRASCRERVEVWGGGGGVEKRESER